MNTKPLPCPFCGAPPTVGPPDSSEGDCHGWVKCENPHCTVNPRADDRREVNGEEGLEHYRQMAVANWNERAISRGTDRRRDTESEP